MAWAPKLERFVHHKLRRSTVRSFSQDDDDATPETYCLSKYFEPIVEKLLATTERQDGSQSNLRSSAYEAFEHTF